MLTGIVPMRERECDCGFNIESEKNIAIPPIPDITVGVNTYIICFWCVCRRRMMPCYGRVDETSESGPVCSCRLILPGFLYCNAHLHLRLQLDGFSFCCPTSCPPMPQWSSVASGVAKRNIKSWPRCLLGQVGACSAGRDSQASQ